MVRSVKILLTFGLITLVLGSQVFLKNPEEVNEDF
jgi:hypothetical protein